MKIRLVDGLPYVSVQITFQRRSLVLDRVVLDTGSFSTLLAADKLLQIGFEPSDDDLLRKVRGIGGIEIVASKPIDSISVGELVANNFTIDVSGMPYNRDLDGLLGLDFLLQTKAIIDLDQLELRQSG